MPESQYEQLSDSVLAWKKGQKLGRFDPNAKSAAELAKERKTKDESEIALREIEVGKRCRIGKEDGRRGIVRFVGEIAGLGGGKEAGCRWVGVELDEPVGRNDGSAKVEIAGGRTEEKRIFECKEKFGVFARPEKVECGKQFVPLNDLEINEDMEEI